MLVCRGLCREVGDYQRPGVVFVASGLRVMHSGFSVHNALSVDSYKRLPQSGLNKWYCRLIAWVESQGPHFGHRLGG